MLPYHGGKQRTGKRITTAIIESVAGEQFDGYVEPFVGRMGVGMYVIGALNISEYVFSRISKALLRHLYIEGFQGLVPAYPPVGHWGCTQHSKQVCESTHDGNRAWEYSTRNRRSAGGASVT